MEIVFLVIGLVIGGIAAWFISSYKYKGEASKVEERSRILETDKSSLQSDLKSERGKSEKLNSENSKLKSDFENLQEKLAEQKNQLKKMLIH